MAASPPSGPAELAVELFCALEGAFLLSPHDPLRRADPRRRPGGDGVPPPVADDPGALGLEIETVRAQQGV